MSVVECANDLYGKLDATVSASASLDYVRSRGYAPLHPLPERTWPLRDLTALRADYATIPDHSANAGLGTAGDLPLTAAELDAVDVDRARVRQEIADLLVAESRESRSQAADKDQWSAWADAERDATKAGAGKRTDSVIFFDADATGDSVSAFNAVRISKAYARLSGHSEATEPGFFADNYEAVLAHAVHISRSDTPSEALGEIRWASYLKAAGGDAQRARHAVASHVATAFTDRGVAYATRVGSETADDLACAIDAVVARWDEDIDSAWSDVDPGPLGRQRAVLGDALIRPRHEIAPEPFDLYDNLPSHITNGGVYCAERGAVDELVSLLSQLRDSHDECVTVVADEIAAQALEVRAMPMDTLAARTERQWRLVELVEAAESLVEDSQWSLEQVVLLPVDDPNQMALFDVGTA